MPVIAVAAGIGGVSALAAGGLTVFQTLAAVGSIFAGVGALTGEKDLMKLGGVMGLAGGVGAFAQGQGWINGDASISNTKAFTQTPAPGLDSSSVRGTASMDVGNQAELGTLADSGTAGVEGSIQEAITQASPATQAMGAGPDLAGATSGLMNSDLASSSLTGGPLGTGSAVTKNAYGIDGLGKSLATQQSSSVFDTMKKWSDLLPKDPQTRALLANFVGGMFDERKQAEADWLKARAASERQQMTNANAIPKGSFTLRQNGPMFPATAPTYTAPRVGLMGA